MSAEDTAGRGSGATGGPDDTGTPRRYDSFHVRLWSEPGGERLLRAEVRHLQTDLVEIGIAVPAEWILSTLRAFLAATPPPSPSTPE